MPATAKRFSGPPRVRHEPPTVADALFAAEGLSSDRQMQIEIASRLLGVSEEEIRPHVTAPRRAAPVRIQSGARMVVVETKAPRSSRRA